MLITATLSEYNSERDSLTQIGEEFKLKDINTSCNRILIFDTWYIISQTLFFDALTNYSDFTKNTFKQVLFPFDRDKLTPTKFLQLFGKVEFEEEFEKTLFFKECYIKISYEPIRIKVPLSYIKKYDMIQIEGKGFKMDRVEFTTEKIEILAPNIGGLGDTDFIKKAANYCR